MKKFISFFVSVAITVGMLPAVVSAETATFELTTAQILTASVTPSPEPTATPTPTSEPTVKPSMDVTWRGDYSDNTDPMFLISFASPALYKQQVAIVVYPASVTSPTLADYVRIHEVTSEGGERMEVPFYITDNMSATDGVYTVELTGNGYLQDICRDSVTFYAIKPGSIPGLLSEFNDATTLTFATTLDKVILPLQLADEADASRKIKRINVMMDIRTEDFEGAFTTLEDVRAAWNISDIIAYITDGGATAAGIKAKIEDNKDLLGVDTQAADYVAYIDAVCQDILVYSSEYNGNTGVSSMKDLNGIINQYVGMHAINAASADTLFGVFEKYKSYMEISDDTLAKYESLPRQDKDKALRAIYYKGFAKATELTTAFETSVKEITSVSGVELGIYEASLNVGENITLKATLTTPSTYSGKLIFATYDKDGRLVDTMLYNADATVDVSLPSKGVAYAKLFWWEMDTLAKYCNGVLVELD